MSSRNLIAALLIALAGCASPHVDTEQTLQQLSLISSEEEAYKILHELMKPSEKSSGLCAYNNDDISPESDYRRDGQMLYFVELRKEFRARKSKSVAGGGIESTDTYAIKPSESMLNLREVYAIHIQEFDGKNKETCSMNPMRPGQRVLWRPTSGYKQMYFINVMHSDVDRFIAAVKKINPGVVVKTGYGF